MAIMRMIQGSPPKRSNDRVAMVMLLLKLLITVELQFMIALNCK